MRVEVRIRVSEWGLSLELGLERVGIGAEVRVGEGIEVKSSQCWGVELGLGRVEAGAGVGWNPNSNPNSNLNPSLPTLMSTPYPNSHQP